MTAAVPLARRYPATPLWDTLWAERGPTLQSTARVSLAAQTATAAALADLPTAGLDPAGGGEHHPAEGPS